MQSVSRRRKQADGGVGRGPGGPPHNLYTFAHPVLKYTDKANFPRRLTNVREQTPISTGLQPIAILFGCTSFKNTKQSQFCCGCTTGNALLIVTRQRRLSARATI